jgi:hypothetical protein
MIITTIAYKWVIEKNGLYYPILNFGINNWRPLNQLNPYKKNIFYCNPKDIFPDQSNECHQWRIRNGFPNFEMPGFHFWKHAINKHLEKYNDYLAYKKSPIINTVLICTLFGVIKENEERIVAKGFLIKDVEPLYSLI